jgi:hypothetical protein
MKLSFLFIHNSPFCIFTKQLHNTYYVRRSKDDI